MHAIGELLETLHAQSDANALIATKDLQPARVELERIETRTGKLGLHSLQARADYLLATVFRLSGSNSLALDHYHASLRLLDDIRKEVGNDQILKRSDFAAMSAEIKRWAASSKS